MKKRISFMHISLDGFVAGPNGEMDWTNIDQEILIMSANASAKVTRRCTDA